MKKLYLLLATLACAMTAFALPEELYLVGNFNNYSTPNNDTNLYVLSPTDSEGGYSGTFDIPAQPRTNQLIFRVFTEKTWNPVKSYGRRWTPDLYCFSNANAETTLYSNKDEDTQYAICSNWKGGRITFSCRLDESKGEMQVTLTTPDQPVTPPVPEKVWVIGDFNDWAVPTASSDNGAIGLTKTIDGFSSTYITPYYVAENAAIPSGKARFVFYYIDPKDSKGKFVESANNPNVFGIYRLSEDEKYGVASGYWSSEKSPVHDNLAAARANATYIANYTGPSLKINFVWNMPLETPSDSYYYWNDAPINDMNHLNLYIENIDTDEKRIIRTEEDNWYISWSKVEISGNVRIWLTDAEELPVVNKWGLYEDANLTKSGSNIRSFCIKDGKPLTVNTGDLYRLITGSIDKRNHTMYCYMYGSDYSNIDKIYVIGYMSSWIPPIENNASKFPVLEEVESGIYEGIVSCPVPSASFPDPHFRFAYALNGWDNPGSIGSSWYDSVPVNVSFADNKYESDITIDGKGNWSLPEWKVEGDVKMRVNLRNLTLTLTNLSENSVTEIGADDENAPVSYYNMQGQRVANPANGIFIRVQGNKSRKVAID